MELRYIKGATEKRIADLNKMGIYSAEDLLRFFPRNYLDMRKTTSLFDAQNNDFVLTKGKVVAIPEYLPVRGKFSYFKVMCEQEGECFTIIWFNQPYVKAKLVVGEEYLFYGRVRNRYGISMTNPTFELIDKNFNLKGIVPVYSIKGVLTQKAMRSMIADALKKVNFNSVIDGYTAKNYGLADLNGAYSVVHNPESFQDLATASERIAVEEYYVLISAFKFIKGDREQARLNRYNVSGNEISEFSSRFGFDFTPGQKKAVNEIFSDLKKPTVMNRLLQGDVGCGKTAVSLCAIYMAVKSGYQAVMLAPTEVLAKQSYDVVKKYLHEFEAGFLSGSLTQKEKNERKKRIADGTYKIIVGTHALLESDVVFKNLSLCVCDEQQRFGVAQRNRLVEKGDATDVLIMSATPIPRTLSLIFYGDLDISTIPDKPSVRTEIQTNIVPKSKYGDMIKFIEREIKSGRQAYFVCPKIDGDDEGSVLSVTEIYEELTKTLPDLNFGLLHGRMKDDKKTEVMLDFKAGKLNAIVSTTVIEVGIDVANATVMVIFGADRFGLSQLHQLRGRVGRSDLKSYCFLLSDTDNETSLERLKVIKDNSDGFRISEHDFDERGGGDFLGTRQSGKLMTDLGNLKYSSSAIFLAKKLSDEAFNSGANLRNLRRIAVDKYEKLKDVTLN